MHIARAARGVKTTYTGAVLPLPEDLAHAIEQRGRGLTILAIRFGALGDILRTLPAVRLVRRALPEARVAWAVDQGWRTMLDGHPDLAHVAAFPRARWDRLRRSPRQWPSLVAALREWRDDVHGAGLVLDFHGNLRSALTGRLSGAPVRIGYSGHQQKEGNRFLTTLRVPPGPRRVSRMERNLYLVRALGLPTEPLPDGALAIPAGAREAARRLVVETVGRERDYAILSPGASRRQAYKRPPARLLSAAARVIADRGIAPIVVYGPGEEPDAERVVAEASGAAWLSPPTDLWTLAALLDGAGLFVGGDTGPLHMACAVSCPVVGIYAPTDPVVNSPWGVPYRVIHPDVAYTGTKKIDRKIGRFDDIPTREAETTVDALLATLGEAGITKAPEAP